MKVAVILSSGAGSLAGRPIGDEIARVARAFRAAGAEAEVAAVEGEGIARAARAALASDADAVVIGGGDGSTSAAAAALVGQPKPLGVLPLGTFNHFAKDLGMPLELEDAARAIVEGTVRVVDVAEVNGRTFINNSVLGVYARVVRIRDMQRHLLGRDRWLALLRGVVGALRQFPLLRIEIVSDDGEAELRATPFVFIGNNDYELPLYPSGGRSSLDRGRLCLYVARPTGRLGILWMALRLPFGGLDKGRDFELMHPREIRIDARKRLLRVLLDGETVYLRPPLRYRSRPKSLRVIAPPPPPDAEPRPAAASEAARRV